MTKFTISIDAATGAPDPSHLSCSDGDKIRWQNNFPVTVDSFDLPSCVSPGHSPAPIDPGDTTRYFTVNNGKHGSFDYEYEFDDEAVERDDELIEFVSVPQSGTIDPA
jgi:hypothetical protein